MFIKPTKLASLALFALSLVPIACGGDGGGSGDGGASADAFEDKCALACTPKKACEGQASAECEQACVTTVKGLSTACAQCIVEHTGWRGAECVCGTDNGEEYCSFEEFGISGD